MDNDADASYAASRAVLKSIAERLRKETDIDIDELIPMIDRASAAFKVCRERVEAVEKLIEERLPPDTSNRTE